MMIMNTRNLLSVLLIIGSAALTGAESECEVDFLSLCYDGIPAPLEGLCSSCDNNSDCPIDGHHCSGQKEDKRCQKESNCVDDGCPCYRKRDCCGQPRPAEGEPDLRCRIPPFNHPKYTMGESTKYCLTNDTWASEDEDFE